MTSYALHYEAEVENEDPDSTVSPVWEREREEINRLRALARSHEERRDWDALAVVLSRLCGVASFENRPEMLKWLAHVRDNRLNDALGAVRSLEAAVDISPTDDDCWDQLVVLYDRLGDVRRMEKALVARFRSPPTSGTVPVSTRRTSTLVSPGQDDERETRKSFESFAGERSSQALGLLEPHALSSPMTVAFEHLARLFCTVAGSVETEETSGFDIPGTGNSVRRLFVSAANFVGVEGVHVDIELTNTSCAVVVWEGARVRVDPCSFREDDTAARFAATAYMARLHPRLKASAFFTSPARLRVLLAWPQRCAPEHHGTVPDLGMLDLRAQANASEAVLTELRELNVMHGAWMAKATDEELRAWLVAARIAEVRAGTAFAATPDAVEVAIERGLWNPSPLSASAAIAEGKAFAASDTFAQVRHTGE